MATATAPIRRPSSSISERRGQSEVERLARKRKFARKQQMENAILIPFKIAVITMSFIVNIILVVASIIGLFVGVFITAVLRVPVAAKTQAIADEARRVGSTK